MTQNISVGVIDSQLHVFGIRLTSQVFPLMPGCIQLYADRKTDKTNPIFTPEDPKYGNHFEVRTAFTLQLIPGRTLTIWSAIVPAGTRTTVTR